MRTEQFFELLGEIDATYVGEAVPPAHAGRRRRLPKRALVLAAVLAIALALCGFAAYELGLFDPWLQQPSGDPLAVVQSAIENQMEKAYTFDVRVDTIRVDPQETRRVSARYRGSELAAARGWTDEVLAEHFVVVWAKYYTEYDHTKTFLDDGYTEQYFYLMQDAETGEWTIVDNTVPDIQQAE